jgi:hypothetical protein
MSKGLSFSVGVQVVSGEITSGRAALMEAVKSWPDCEATLAIEADDAKRSNAANRYLFGVIYRDIEAYTEQPKEDIHDEMCARFTTKTIHYTNPATGEIVEMEVVTRTSGMTVSEFHAFVEKVKLFAAEFFGLTFEDAPDEFYKERDRAAARDAKRSAA